MTLDEAADRYQQATRNLTMARDAATTTRRLHHNGKATNRQWANANQHALDARTAWQEARDQLVTAALNHTCP